MRVMPFTVEEDVVSAQLCAERSHEDDIRISVDATVLVQNIRSPRVTDARQVCHVLSIYLPQRRSGTVLKCKTP